MISSDGTLYFGDYCCESQHDEWGGAPFYAVDRFGSVRWAFATGGGRVSCSAAISADNTIYCMDDCNLLALTPDGRVKWAYPSSATETDISPAIALDGTIYFASDAIYALEGTSPLADSPWPKYQHDLRNTGCATGARE